ncbi:MAG: glycosyltransferase family 4 protein [Proteobacteria bacterium]|nr:MAG: glycosyltransferase family 4 protein [Pseudomonadota bacterium]
MRAVVLIDSLAGGGAQRVTAALCRDLVSDRYAVTLATLNADDVDFFDPGAGVERARLGAAPARSFAGKSLVNIQRLRRLRALLKAKDPAIVIAMMTPCAVLSLVANLGLRARTLVCERNFPGRKRIGAAWSLLRKIFYRLADGHVAQTREGADWIIRHTRARNVHIVPNPVLWPLPVRDPVRDPSNWVGRHRFFVLAVGTKWHQKGFDLLIKAFASIAVRFPEWDLVVLGVEHDGAGALRRFADAEGLGSRLILPGLAGNVGEWYQGAGVFVLSSRYEGFPNVLLEAMATGCACVAVDCDTGPRDIIEDGVSGRLVAAGDTAALAGAIAELIEDAGKRARFGRAALSVRERFDETRIMAKWRGAIESVLPNTSRRRKQSCR